MVTGRVLIIYGIGLIYFADCRRDLNYNGNVVVHSPIVEPPAVWETNSEDWSSQSSFSVPQYWTRLYNQYWDNTAQSLHYPSKYPVIPCSKPYRSNLINNNYSFGNDENGHYIYIPGKTLDSKRKPNSPWNYAPGMWVTGKNKYDLRNFYLSLRKYPFDKQLASLRKYQTVIRS